MNEDMMPLVSRLDARRQELERHYSALKARWDDDEAYYEGSFTFDLPERAHKSIPATGRNAIEVPADHIITDKPVVTRSRTIKTRKDDEADDRIEAWGQGWLQELEELSETPPLVEAVKHQLLRGMAILLGPFFNKARFDNGEDMWLWYDSEDPKHVLMPPGPDPKEVFIVSELTVSEMESRAMMESRMAGFDRAGRKDTDLLTLVEWYGYLEGQDIFDPETHYAAWEKSQADWIVEPTPSGYPYIPATRVYSGYGRRARGAKPDEIAVSILNPQVQTLLEDEAYCHSVLSSAVGAAVWERWRAPTEEAASQIEMDYTPGSVSIIPQDVQRLEQEALPMAMIQFLQVVEGKLEFALFSGVIAGHRPRGVDTASGLAILSGQSRLKFGRPLRLLQAGLSQVMRKVGMLMAHLQEQAGDDELDFTIRARELTAKDWGDNFAVRVRLMADDPEAEASRVSRGVMLKDHISEKTRMERYFAIDNVTEELEQKTFERIINSVESDQQILELVGLLRREEQAKEQVREQSRSNGNRIAGGMDNLAMMRAMAQMQRASRPGGLEQQRPFRGTIEEQSRMMQHVAPGMRMPR